MLYSLLFSSFILLKNLLFLKPLSPCLPGSANHYRRHDPCRWWGGWFWFPARVVISLLPPVAKYGPPPAVKMVPPPVALPNPPVPALELLDAAIPPEFLAPVLSPEPALRQHPPVPAPSQSLQCPLLQGQSLLCPLLQGQSLQCPLLQGQSLLCKCWQNAPRNLHCQSAPRNPRYLSAPKSLRLASALQGQLLANALQCLLLASALQWAPQRQRLHTRLCVLSQLHFYC